MCVRLSRFVTGSANMLVFSQLVIVYLSASLATGPICGQELTLLFSEHTWGCCHKHYCASTFPLHPAAEVQSADHWHQNIIHTMTHSTSGFAFSCTSDAFRDKKEQQVQLVWKNRRSNLTLGEKVKKKRQSHWLNKSKPVQQRQTICNKCQYFQNALWWGASIQTCTAFCTA